MTNQRLDAALHLANLGFRIIPIRPGAKIPSIPRWPEAASNDPTVIRGWFSNGTGYNLGVALGEQTGLVVVDIDAHHGGDFTIEVLEGEHGDLPVTPTVETPHGGRHLYFKYPWGVTLKNNSSGLIGPGIDFRTDGGQCVLPPSSLDGVSQSYRWAILPPVDGEGVQFAELPEWIIDRVRADVPRKAAVPRSPKLPVTGGMIAQGARNDGMFRALCAMREHQGLSDAEIHSAADEINRTRCSPSLPEAEIRTIAASVCRYPAGTPGIEQLQQEKAQTKAQEPVTATEAEDKPKIKWIKNRDGKLSTHVANVMTALNQMDSWKGCVRYNEFTCSIVKVKHTPYGAPPGPWTDEDDTAAAAWFADHKLGVSSKTVYEGVNCIAHRDTYNPVRDYLESLKWDGVPRCNTWTERFMGARSRSGNTDYVQAVSAKWLISAVARAFWPGCKVDHMLILEGEQGTGKSTAVMALCPAQNWFTNDVSVLGREAAMALRGKWLIEFSELQALAKHQVEEAKAFLSRDVDYYREPYGRRAKDWPRRCVFVGTTNSETYLSDETGNRRYWPLQCDTIRPSGIEAERDQLWAEAVHRFKSGEKWWLDQQEISISAREEQAARSIKDEWEPIIAEWTEGMAVVTIGDILHRRFQIQPGMWSPADEKRVGKCLRRLGWKYGNARVDGRVRHAYKRVADVASKNDVAPVADVAPHSERVSGVDVAGSSRDPLQNDRSATPQVAGLSNDSVCSVCSVLDINSNRGGNIPYRESGATPATPATSATTIQDIADQIIRKAGGGNGKGN